MRLSRRDRGALIILLLAVVALAVDRLLVPTPDTILAEGGEDRSLEQAVGQPVEDMLPELPASDTEESPLLGPVADVFDLSRQAGSQSWRRLSPADTVEESAVERFVREHTLQATVLGPRPLALVGRRQLRVGDSLGGFELISVGEREAVFVSDEGEAVLRVASRSGGS